MFLASETNTPRKTICGLKRKTTWIGWTKEAVFEETACRLEATKKLLNQQKRRRVGGRLKTTQRTLYIPGEWRRMSTVIFRKERARSFKYRNHFCTFLSLRNGGSTTDSSEESYDAKHAHGWGGIKVG